MKIFCRLLPLILIIHLIDRLEAKMWTLSQMAKYGQEHAPTFQEGRAYEKIHHVNQMREKAAFAPKIDLSAHSEYAIKEGQSNRTLSNATGNRINLGLASTIFDLGQRELLVQMAADEVAVAVLGQQERTEQFLLALAQEYYDLQLQLQLAQINLDKQQLMQGQLRTVEALYRQGQRPRTDYLRFQAEIARINLTTVSIQNAITQAELKLKKRIGWVDLDERFQVTELVFENYSQLIVPKGPPSLEQTVLVRRYQILLEKAKKLVLLKEKETGPNFQLLSAANYGNQHTLDHYSRQAEFPGNSWNFLLKAQVQINLYDGGLSKQIVAKERIEQELVFYRYRQERDELERKVLGLIAQLAEFWQHFKLNDQLVKLEQNSFADIRQRYQGGLSSYLDYVNASTSLINAQIGKIYAYVNLQKTFCEYYLYEGTIDEKCIQ